MIRAIMIAAVLSVVSGYGLAEEGGGTQGVPSKYPIFDTTSTGPAGISVTVSGSGATGLSVTAGPDGRHTTMLGVLDLADGGCLIGPMTLHGRVGETTIQLAKGEHYPPGCGQ